MSREFQDVDRKLLEELKDCKTKIRELRKIKKELTYAGEAFVAVIGREHPGLITGKVGLPAGSLVYCFRGMQKAIKKAKEKK